MNALALLTSPVVKWLAGALLIVAILGGVYFKGRHDEKAVMQAAIAKANAAADRRAEALSTDLLIEQAKAMGATARKANDGIQQVKAASTDAAAARAAASSVRAILGSPPNAP